MYREEMAHKKIGTLAGILITFAIVGAILATMFILSFIGFLLNLPWLQLFAFVIVVLAGFFVVKRYICLLYTSAGADCFAAGTDTKNETVSELEQKFEADYNAAVKELLIFIERARTEYSLADAEPVPFRWSIYRQRPQLRYTLASHIIRGVMNGQYPVGSYLPSLQQMANSYGVGQMCIRDRLRVVAK